MFGDLEKLLGYCFKDKELLRLALTHPSYAEEKGRPMYECNERLEFLGDSVLNIAITQALFHKYPRLPEGKLTKARANLISRASMARLGVFLGLGNLLYLSKGEESVGGRALPSLAGNAMEAVFGAIFLDSDLETAICCICKLLENEIENDPFKHQIQDNPKGELQEFVVRRGYKPPIYELLSQTGPAHHLMFECRVMISGKEIAHGIGSRRQSAEAAAAREALNLLRLK